MGDKPAIEFLKKHGQMSLVSLGCGDRLNRLDNHVRLFVGCGLEHYVGIDRVSDISLNPQTAFSDAVASSALLSGHSCGNHEKFGRRIKVFPDTLVERTHG